MDEQRRQADMRSSQARKRIVDLEARRQRLRERRASTDEDVSAAATAAAQAEERALASHARAANAHLRAAQLAEGLGHSERAEWHRVAARADTEAAAGPPDR